MKRYFGVVVFASSLFLGCGSAATGQQDAGQLDGLPNLESAQAVADWIASGQYKQWNCEAQPTTKTQGDPAIHVHGTNRVCVNTTLKNAVAGQAVPKGAAAVKEIHEQGAVTKHYLEVKVQEDSADGQGWYWYDAAAGSTGSGSRGRAACVGCHKGAGSDAMHPGHGDYVYFVPP